MKNIFFSCCLFLLMLMGPYGAGAVDIDWTELKPIHLDKNAADIAVSSDGKMMFVLGKGEIQIFLLDEQKAIKQIKVDEIFDRLAVRGIDNTLILSSSSSNIIKQIQIELVYDIDITGLPVKGPEDAPVVIAVFDHYQCGYCGRLNPLLEQVLKKYPNEVKLVIKHFPLRSHTYAQKAALAALAAGEQGKFWEFHDLLFQNAAALSDAKVLEIAEQLRLDVDRFKKDKDSEKIKRIVEKSTANGYKIGVRGTPAVYINGKFLQKRNLPGFEKLIEETLKKIKN